MSRGVIDCFKRQTLITHPAPDAALHHKPSICGAIRSTVPPPAATRHPGTLPHTPSILSSHPTHPQVPPLFVYRSTASLEEMCDRLMDDVTLMSRCVIPSSRPSLPPPNLSPTHPPSPAEAGKYCLLMCSRSPSPAFLPGGGG